MGHIEFEGWNVEIDDIKTLNRSPEVLRMGLIFEQHANLICASARGNVSAYYCILVEVKRRLISGGFNVNVTLSTGEKEKSYCAQPLLLKMMKTLHVLSANRG